MTRWATKKGIDKVGAMACEGKCQVMVSKCGVSVLCYRKLLSTTFSTSPGNVELMTMLCCPPPDGLGAARPYRQ